MTVLWGHFDTVFKFFLVVGGLGVKPFCLFNEALLVKWKWHLVTERESLWQMVVGVISGGIILVGRLGFLDILTGLVCGRL